MTYQHQLNLPAAPDLIVVTTDDTTTIYKPVTFDSPEPRQALRSYMMATSEVRWCAGWLSGLETALLDDPAYRWLVTTAGGWWEWNPDWKIGDRYDTSERFIEGSLTDLEAKR